MNQESLMVIVAAVVNFFLGGVWYSFFKKKWMTAWDLDETAVNRKDPAPYLIAFIGSLWASYGLFLTLKHIQPKNMLELYSIGIAFWLFIFVGLGAKHYAFARKTLNAFLIDYLVDLIGILVMISILWKTY